jgi:flagellar motor protein MotB
MNGTNGTAPASSTPASSTPASSTPASLAAREVALARARALARHSRYAEAAALIDQLLSDELSRAGGPAAAAALDLRARIHAQQGQLDQADSCWAEAERLAPGSGEYAAGRRRIARMRTHGRRPTAQLALRTGGVLAAALALALLIDIRFTVGDSTAPTASRNPSQAPLARPSAAVGTSSARTASGSTAPAGDVLAALDLQVPGVRVQRTPDQISVIITSGVFTDGTSFSASGRAVLARLGARLRPYAARVTVAIVGYTDDIPVPPGRGYADNIELGLLRAETARADLSAISAIPLAMFPVSSMGDEQLPFPDPSDTAQPRDRTVTLWISAIGEG